MLETRWPEHVHRFPIASYLTSACRTVTASSSCRSSRLQSFATIVLTARDPTDEKVAALDLGADDYVVKPLDTAELLARVRVALRHSESNAGTTEHLVAGDIAIDLPAHRVTRAGIDVHLTRKEFGLLAELARHAGRVLTHTSALHHLGQSAYRRRGIFTRCGPQSARNNGTKSGRTETHRQRAGRGLSTQCLGSLAMRRHLALDIGGRLAGGLRAAPSRQYRGSTRRRN